MAQCAEQLQQEIRQQAEIKQRLASFGQQQAAKIQAHEESTRRLYQAVTEQVGVLTCAPYV